MISGLISITLAGGSKELRATCAQRNPEVDT
jgi:hypothetical protein